MRWNYIVGVKLFYSLFSIEKSKDDLCFTIISSVECILQVCTLRRWKSMWQKASFFTSHILFIFLSRLLIGFMFILINIVNTVVLKTLFRPIHKIDHIMSQLLANKKYFRYCKWIVSNIIFVHSEIKKMAFSWGKKYKHLKKAGSLSILITVICIHGNFSGIYYLDWNPIYKHRFLASFTILNNMSLPQLSLWIMGRGKLFTVIWIMEIF